MGRYPKIRTIKVCNFCKRDETETEFNQDYKPTECKECLGKRRMAWYAIHKYETNRRKVEERRRRNKLPMIYPETRKRGRPQLVFADEVDYMIDEKNLKVIEVYCSHFGCGKILTRTEKLAGNRCLKHQVYIRKIF